MKYALTARAKELGITLTRAYPGDAGMDLYCCSGDMSNPIYNKEGVSVASGDYASMSTGIYVEIPHGYYGQIATKSSVAQYGLFVIGGVIDSGYRGEIKVVLANTSPHSFRVLVGQKIAQLLILPVWMGQPELVEVDDFTESERGIKGFGSSGNSLERSES